MSLADFKPANRDVILCDLDRLFDDALDRDEYYLNAFRKKFPTAWGFVWAYPPGYSKDGKTAVVFFEGGPNGSHGLSWVYMVARKGKRWEVLWRHLRPREWTKHLLLPLQSLWSVGLRLESILAVHLSRVSGEP